MIAMSEQATAFLAGIGLMVVLMLGIGTCRDEGHIPAPKACECVAAPDGTPR